MDKISPVDASCVAVPDINEQALHGLASIYIDVLRFEIHVDAGLVLLDVLTDVLAEDVVGAICYFRSKDAGSIGSEDCALSCLRGVVENTGLVVVDCFELLQESEIATELLGF